MKLPTNRVKLLQLVDLILQDLNFSEGYIARVKRDSQAIKLWEKSDQEFILLPHNTFASPGGVKSRTCKIIAEPGIYGYFYLPDEECVYVGSAVDINQRVASGKAVARAIIKTGEPPRNKIYPGVEKMFDKDSTLTNWGIAYMPTFSICIAEEQETKIVLNESTRPRFNDPKMVKG